MFSCSVAAAQAETTRLMSAWQFGPLVKVVASAADLPVPAPWDARGLFWRKVVWVVADSQPQQLVARTLAHEVVAHYGLRESLGPAWRGFMSALQAGARGGDAGLVALRDTVRCVYEDAALPSHIEADELCAAAAEQWVDARTGRMTAMNPWRKRAAAIFGMFARERLYMNTPASANQLEGALLAAEHHVRYGGPVYGLGSRVRRWYAGQMRKNDSNRPPMSMAESERLLEAENVTTASAANLRYGWSFFYLIARVVLCLGALSGIIWLSAAIVGNGITIALMIVLAIFYFNRK